MNGFDVCDGFTGIIGENLSELDREADALAERRAAHLAEAASLCSALLSPSGDDENGFLSDEFLDAYSGIFGERKAAERRCTDALNHTALETSALCGDVGEKIQFCRLLAENCEKRFMTAGKPFALTAMLLKNLTGETEPSCPRGRVSYLRSSFADSAFSYFSSAINDPTVTYARDFNSVCEDVYYGRAGNCILPIENSAEGTLASFRNLILKYELKIVRTAMVGVGEYSSTRFALCRRELAFPRDWSADVTFELCVTPRDEASLAPLLMAAVGLGGKPLKLESVPMPDSYGDRCYAYDLAFSCTRQSLDPFILYLLLQSPGFDVVGLYTEISTD